MSKEGKTSKLDRMITETAYRLECLIALRNVMQSGCCNDCDIRKDCEYAPRLGGQVRYNCPFYERIEEEE